MSSVGRVKEPQHRKAYVRAVIDPESNKKIDTGLFLWFRGPHSFTGEDVCEIHTHGSLAVIKSLSSTLSAIEGLKLAEPGEFTKRAFLNNKMDLSQVESLADVIEAETGAQLEQAMRGGLLHEECTKWTNLMKSALARVEAYIDFSEDDHIDEVELLEAVHTLTSQALSDMESVISNAPAGQVIREGIRVVITGRPNVGKSSLVNILSQAETSIVSHIAGTTRDLIKVSLDFGGFPIILCDTAGNRLNTEDPVEKEGIKRAEEYTRRAQLNILICDDPKDVEADRTRLGTSEKSITILNKMDLFDMVEVPEGIDHVISCSTGEGIPSLIAALLERLAVEYRIDTPTAIIRDRQLNLIEEARKELRATFSHTQDKVIVAEHIRLALSALGRISGRVGSEDILDMIFGEFCIGK